MLETMAAGVSVTPTAVTMLLASFGETARVVGSGDASPIEEACRDLQASPMVTRAWKAPGPRFVVERFSVLASAVEGPSFLQAGR